MYTQTQIPFGITNRKLGNIFFAQAVKPKKMFKKNIPGTPRRPTIYKRLAINWMIPNLYIGNGWKSPFPSIYKWLEMGFQV